MRNRLLAFMVINMNAEELLVEATKQRWKAEIEKAIDKVKLGMIPAKPRTKLDEWWRRRYYIETNRLGKQRQIMASSSGQEQNKSEVNRNEKMQTLRKVEDAGRS